MDLAARAIELLIVVLMLSIGLFAGYIFSTLLRIPKTKFVGVAYRGGMGQWSWAFQRISGVLLIGFLFGHIVDTFTVGLAPSLYNKTISLYKQWWFKPFEIILIGSALYHGLNGFRIILFDFWPTLATRQRAISYAMWFLFLCGFIPACVIMIRAAIETMPFLNA